MKFSDRIGITKAGLPLIDDINDDIRTALWNVIVSRVAAYDKDRWRSRHKVIYRFIHKPIDNIPLEPNRAFNTLHIWFLHEWEWYEVYNVVEHIISAAPIFGETVIDMANRFNVALEHSNSGYRFVDFKLAPVISANEIKEIEQAASTIYQGVNTHIQTATSLMSQKPKPDYRNSIKESISAVESAAKVISGNEKGTLQDALDKLHETMPIHGAMKQGFEKLYGYTSDEGGIRHSLLDDDNVAFDEAKFMLVACSAFCNYLISCADKAGLLDN